MVAATPIAKVPSESNPKASYVVARTKGATVYGPAGTIVCECRAFRYYEKHRPCKHIKRVANAIKTKGK